MNTEKIKNLLSEISPWPWCEDYCYEAIRHVHKNCDIVRLEHEDLDKCKSFGRYDGSFISKAPEIIDQLLKQNEILRDSLGLISKSPYFYFQNVDEDVARLALKFMINLSEETLKKCDEIEIEND